MVFGMRCPLCKARLIENDRRCPRCDALTERLPFMSLNLEDSPADIPDPVSPASRTGSTKVELGGDARIVGALGGDFSSWSGSGEWAEPQDAFLGLSAEDYLGAATGVVDRQLVEQELVRQGLATPVYVDDGVARMLKAEAVLALRPGDDAALSAFERHVASFLDGERPIARVARKANLSLDDARIALALLVDKQRAVLVGHMIVPARFREARPAPPREPVRPPPLPSDALTERSEEHVRPAMQARPQQAREATRAERVPPPRATTAPAEVRSAPHRPFDPSKRAPPPGTRYGEQQDVRLLKLAMQKEADGAYDDAVRLLRKAIEVNPDAAVLYNRLGVVLATRLKDYAAASEALFHACELEPNNDTYMSNLAKVAERSEAQRAEAEREKASFGGIGKALFRRRR